MKLGDIGDKLSAMITRPTNKKAITLGLDIGSHSVKLLGAEKNGSGRRVFVLEICPVKNNDPQGAVMSIIDKVGANNKEVILGLSGQQVVIRSILLPDMSEADFKNSLKYEAAKHIPFAIKDVILDASILKHSIGKGKMLVLLVAAKKELIDQKIKLVSALGIEPDVIDVDSLAVTNLLRITAEKEQKNDATSASALLNIGKQISGLVLLQNGLIRFSRDIIFGGNDITFKIAAALGIDIGHAEEKKISGQWDDSARDAIASTLANLISELRLSFDYYESQTGKAVENVYLSGGGSCLLGIDKIMSQAMNIPFKVWNPLSALEIDDALKKEAGGESGSRRFAVAAGLALR
ncbi:MAG: type IV pilus assembly protein PilM [Candidatus Omnitrophota bacterium]